MHHRNDEGFTLIELLVVVIVIGILSSIAMPQFLAQRDSASASSAIATLRSVLTAGADLINGKGEFLTEGQAALVIESSLTTFDVVGPSTAPDRHTQVSVDTAADGGSFVLSTRAPTGECFFLRMLSDGTMEHHRDDGLIACSADQFAPTAVASGW